MDDDMQAMDVRDREIELRLEAFASVRLSPDREAVARTRGRIMREARLQFEASRIAAHMAPAIVRVSRRHTARRLAMPILAASVLLGIAVGSISAATAGGPLYPARMWVENAILPADGAARANAEISRLDDRVAEAVAGAAHGDAGAVQAALDAYRQISDDAIAGATGNETLEALVAAALDRHVSVLTAVAATLESKGNDTAAAAVEASILRAIGHSQAVVERLGANSSGGGGNGSSGRPVSDPGATGGNGTGAGAGAGAGGGGAGAGGSATDPTGNGKPDKTPKPAANPTPKPTPDPQGQPDHTPHGPNP